MSQSSKDEKEMYEQFTGVAVSKDADGDYVHHDIATGEPVLARHYAECFEKHFPCYVCKEPEANETCVLQPNNEAEKALWLKWNDALVEYHAMMS